MMEFSFPKQIGNRIITIKFEADTPADFFEQIAFYDSLPERSPKGATDLRFVVRHPKDKSGNPVTYYSIISETDGLELKIGQHRNNPKSLFVKGEWVRLVSGRDAGDDEEASSEQSSDSAQQTQVGLANGKSDREEKLTIQIREMFDARGIDSIGDEKNVIVRLLKLSKGLTLSELTLDQKFVLYDKLYNKDGSGS